MRDLNPWPLPCEERTALQREIGDSAKWPVAIVDLSALPGLSDLGSQGVAVVWVIPVTFSDRAHTSWALGTAAGLERPSATGG